MDERRRELVRARVLCTGGWFVPVRGEPKRTVAKSHFVKQAIVKVKERDKLADVYL